MTSYLSEADTRSKLIDPAIHERGWTEDHIKREEMPGAVEINRVLARHYGFTDEELDFIVNYDIKYRMGKDAGEENE